MSVVAPTILDFGRIVLNFYFTLENLVLWARSETIGYAKRD